MRTVLLIAAGLAGMLTGAPAAQAQYYDGWGYYRPYYAVPYGYYPGPYYAPPPMVAPRSERWYPRASMSRSRPRSVSRRTRVVVVHRPLVNPLLGPLPSAPPARRH